MPQQLFQILLLVIQLLTGLVIGMTWHIIKQQNRRIELLDVCVDRRFELLDSRHYPESQQLATLTESYAQMNLRLEVLRVNAEKMHGQNQELMSNIVQKVDSLLLEELRDLRTQRRNRGQSS